MYDREALVLDRHLTRRLLSESANILENYSWLTRWTR